MKLRKPLPQQGEEHAKLYEAGLPLGMTELPPQSVIDSYAEVIPDFQIRLERMIRLERKSIRNECLRWGFTGMLLGLNVGLFISHI